MESGQYWVIYDGKSVNICGGVGSVASIGQTWTRNNCQIGAAFDLLCRSPTEDETCKAGVECLVLPVIMFGLVSNEGEKTEGGIMEGGVSVGVTVALATGEVHFTYLGHQSIWVGSPGFTHIICKACISIDPSS